jgi:hypothetical protein
VPGIGKDFNNGSQVNKYSQYSKLYASCSSDRICHNTDRRSWCHGGSRLQNFNNFNLVLCFNASSALSNHHNEQCQGDHFHFDNITITVWRWRSRRRNPSDYCDINHYNLKEDLNDVERNNFFADITIARR